MFWLLNNFFNNSKITPISKFFFLKKDFLWNAHNCDNNLSNHEEYPKRETADINENIGEIINFKKEKEEIIAKLKAIFKEKNLKKNLGEFKNTKQFIKKYRNFFFFDKIRRNKKFINFFFFYNKKKKINKRQKKIFQNVLVLSFFKNKLKSNKFNNYFLILKRTPNRFATLFLKFIILSQRFFYMKKPFKAKMEKLGNNNLFFKKTFEFYFKFLKHKILFFLFKQIIIRIGIHSRHTFLFDFIKQISIFYQINKLNNKCFPRTLVNSYFNDEFNKQWLMTKQFNDEKLMSNFFKKNKILKDFQFKYSSFIKEYISGYFEYFFKKKTYMRIYRFRAINVNLAATLFQLFLKLRYMQRQIKKHFNLREFINVLWVSFFSKNMEILKEWFVFTLNGVPFYKHRNVLNTFRVLMIYGRKFLFKHNNIIGFKFDLRGKVSVGGNKRKRHFYLTYGHVSLSSKDLRIEYTQGSAWSRSGALGLTCLLAY